MVDQISKNFPGAFVVMLDIYESPALWHGCIAEDYLAAVNLHISSGLQQNAMSIGGSRHEVQKGLGLHSARVLGL